MTTTHKNSPVSRKRVTFAPSESLVSTHVFQPEKKTNQRIRKKGKNNDNKKHINLLYCNINGIRGKVRSLKEVMTTEETDIAMITETKGPPPAMEGYTWYSKERKNRKGEV